MIEAIAGEGIGAGQTVYFGNDGKLYLVDRLSSREQACASGGERIEKGDTVEIKDGIVRRKPQAAGQLTRKQTLSMPAGPELDTLIAEKVMGIYQHFPPKYSTDIEAAWAVLDHLNCGVNLSRTRGTNSDSSSRVFWSCELIFGLRRFCSGECKTAALAICRAALLAVTS